MKRIQSSLISVLLAFGVSCPAAPTEIEKVSRAMVWEPGPEGKQVPPLARGSRYSKTNGGHLAAAVSNAENRTYEPVDAADRESSRLDFAILLYPGHLWDERSPEAGLGLPRGSISAHAPPTLLIHAMNDPTIRTDHHGMA